MDNRDNAEMVITELNNEDVLALLGMSPEDKIYILPESNKDGVDILNEYSPDMRKIATANGIECEVIHGEEYYFLDLKSSEVILPLILGITSNACFELIKMIIQKYFISSPNTLKVRIITKNKKRKNVESKYEKIELKGTANDVLKAMKMLQSKDNNDE